MASDTDILNSLSSSPKYSNLKPQIEGLRAQKHSDTDILNSLVSSPKYSVLKPQVEQFRSEAGETPAVPAAAPSRSIGQHIGTAISNIPEDVAGIAKDVYQVVRHPIDTARSVGNLAEGAGVAIGEAMPESFKKPGHKPTPEDEVKAEAARQLVKPITESIKHPAGIPRRMAEYAEAHPVRAAINTSLALGGAGKIADIAGAEKAGSALKAASELSGPVSGPIKAIDKIPYVRQIKPSNWLPAIYNKAKATPFAQEGERLAKETGIDLTPAQRTGSKGLSYFEQTARDYPTTADQVRVFDVKQANQAIDSVNKVMDKIGQGGKGADTVGDQVQTAINNAVNATKKVRRVQADMDYGAVRALAGDKPIIKLDNLKSTLQSIINDYDIPGGEPIVKQAKAMLGRVGEKQTIERAMNMRRVYSDAARGTGNVFGDLDKSQSRMLAVRLMKAVESDFEAAPTTVEDFGNLRDALKEANKNYREYSQHIGAIENSVLGKMLGKDVVDPMSGMVVKGVAPEKVAKKLMSLHPSELRVAKQILQGNSPETWNSVRRYAVEQALNEAMDVPPSAGMNPIPMSSSKFINRLPAKQNMEIFFDKHELKQLNDIQSALVRIGDRSTANTSKTALVSDLLKWFTPRGATEQAGKMAGMKVIANAMTTPEGRAAMTDMIKAARSGDSSRYKFLKDALIAEYAVGIAEENYNSIKNINGIKYGLKNGEWYAL